MRVLWVFGEEEEEEEGGVEAVAGRRSGFVDGEDVWDRGELS